jgi:hypothetical protein
MSLTPAEEEVRIRQIRMVAALQEDLAIARLRAPERRTAAQTEIIQGVKDGRLHPFPAPVYMWEFWFDETAGAVFKALL